MSNLVARFSENVVDNSLNDEWNVYELYDEENEDFRGFMGITQNWDGTQTIRYEYDEIPATRHRSGAGLGPLVRRGQWISKDETDVRTLPELVIPNEDSKHEIHIKFAA